MTYFPEPHNFDTTFDSFKRFGRSFDEWLDDYLEKLRVRLEDDYAWYVFEHGDSRLETRREHIRDYIDKHKNDEFDMGALDPFGLRDPLHPADPFAPSQPHPALAEYSGAELPQDPWTESIKSILDQCSRLEDYLDDKLKAEAMSAREYTEMLQGKMYFEMRFPALPHPGMKLDDLPLANRRLDRRWKEGDGEDHATQLRDRLRQSVQRVLELQPQWRQEVDHLWQNEIRLPCDNVSSSKVTAKTKGEIAKEGQASIWVKFVHEFEEQRSTILQFMREKNCSANEIERVRDSFEDHILNNFEDIPDERFSGEYCAVLKQAIHVMKATLENERPDLKDLLENYLKQCRDGLSRQ